MWFGRVQLDRRGIAIELRAGLSERHCRDKEDEDRKSDSSWHLVQLFPILETSRRTAGPFHIHKPVRTIPGTAANRTTGA